MWGHSEMAPHQEVGRRDFPDGRTDILAVEGIIEMITFLKVCQKFENNNQLLSLTLILHTLLKYINDRKAQIPFMFCYRQLSQKSKYSKQSYK